LRKDDVIVVSIVCANTGLFGENKGLFCGNTGIFGGNTWFFGHLSSGGVVVESILFALLPARQPHVIRREKKLGFDVCFMQRASARKLE